VRGKLTVTYGADKLFPSALYKEASETGSSMGEGAINGHRQDLEPREGGLQLALFMAGIGTFT
jgi:hypothetical protein